MSCVITMTVINASRISHPSSESVENSAEKKLKTAEKIKLLMSHNTAITTLELSVEIDNRKRCGEADKEAKGCWRYLS